MDQVMLARWQFGITTTYHFFFVPLTLGLSLLIALMQTAYYRTGDETYKKMTKFWGKLFLLNFAVGVATGIVQEFQFGMNWSEYSRFVGDIFGAPLAFEALMAFFLESTFLGLWIFGWDKLSKRVHLACIWVVAIASNISAMWILIANSFMQQPVGYVINNGRAEMNDFLALITNPHVFHQFPHVFTSAVATTGFFVMAISAFQLLRKNEEFAEMFSRSFRWAVIYALVGSVSVALAGHDQAQYMVQAQPMKMAAAEALWDSEDPAAMSLFTIGNEAERRDVFAIKVPGLLSFLAYNRFDGEVQGINNLQAEYEQTYGPGNYVPPVAFSYWSFRIMVGAGTLMIFIAAYGLFLVMRNQLMTKEWFLKLSIAAVALPYLANSAGWLFTEIGRQPWIVFGLQLTEDGVSPNVSVPMLITSLVGFTLVYAVLMVANVYLIIKFSNNPGGGHDDELNVPAGTPAGAYAD